MAKLDRKDIKIFADDNTNDEIVQFGSTRQGTPVPSKDPDVLQSLSNILEGWKQGVIASTGVPPFEEFNTLQYLATRELAYIQQAGIQEYSVTTNYYAGKSIVRSPETSTLYISLTDDNLGNPLTDIVNWKELGDLEVLKRVVSATQTTLGTTILPQQIGASNNATDPDHDFDFTAGNAILSDGSGQVVATAETKQLDSTWAAGSGNGGLAEGLTIAADTTYYSFVLANSNNEFVGFGFDTSITAVNLLADTNVIAAGGTKYKRIKSFLTDGSANIRSGNYTFFNGNYKFMYSSFIVAFSGTTPALNTDLLLDCPPNTHALLSGNMGHSGAACIYNIGSKVEGDNIKAAAIGNIVGARDAIVARPILTDSLSNIKHGRNTSLGSAGITLELNGWIEYL